MSVHPIELSTRLIDSGALDTPPNRVTQELSELADGVALIESFSHVLVVDSGDGLIAFDSSRAASGLRCSSALRTWSAEPVHTIVYTHGHADHVGGSRAMIAEARDAAAAPGGARPRLDRARFDRYEHTAGYNRIINMRQFGGAAKAAGAASSTSGSCPRHAPAGRDLRDRLAERSVTSTSRYHHCKGETDDHTWTWLPEHRMIMRR